MIVACKVCGKTPTGLGDKSEIAVLRCPTGCMTIQIITLKFETSRKAVIESWNINNQPELELDEYLIK